MMQCTFKLRNETKNTVRYEEIDGDGQVLEFSDANIGQLYIRKSKLDKPYPQSIEVEVRAIG